VWSLLIRNLLTCEIIEGIYYFCDEVSGQCTKYSRRHKAPLQTLKKRTQEEKERGGIERGDNTAYQKDIELLHLGIFTCDGM
jgi:hypothetical protein